jgi:hypothetical protein
VTLDGQPLPNATVVFSPLRATAPGPFSGTTDAEGHYKLGSTDSPTGGASTGEYMVMISTVKSDPNANEYTPAPTQKEIVPSDWRNGSQRFTVPADGTTSANFEMKSR